MPAQRTNAARWLVVAFAALVGVAIGAGCAASDDRTNQEAPPTLSLSIGNADLTEAEAELLRQISIVDGEVYSNGQLLIETFSASQLSRTQLVAALAEADPEDPRRMYQVAEQTRPVETLQTDRTRYIVYLADLMARNRGYQEALEANNLFAVHQHVVAVMLARANMLHDVSPFFCARALVQDPERPCEDGAARLGRDRDYGDSLRAVFRNLASRLEPHTRLFPTQYEADEKILAADALLTAVFDTLRRALDAVRQLEPPLELRPDHERLERYLSESLDVFTVPESSQPVEQQLNDWLDQFATLTDAARDDLSPTAMAIVSPYLGE